MRLFFLMLVFSVSELSIASEKSILRVYTNSSFASEWGPGPTIKKDFEEFCKCTLKYVSLADGNALIARLKLEKPRPKADVIVGIDETITTAAAETGLFIDSNIRLEKSLLPKEIKPMSQFVPYDFGYYAFMQDTNAKNADGKSLSQPKSMDELLTNPEFRKSIIIQDPRSSAPGFALMLWLKALYGNNAPEKLELLKKQVLTVAKGWSEAYKLFTKGEAPFVFSYTTSEAYHLAEEKTSRYKALIFKEGHYMAIEYAAVLKTSENQDLAQKFVKHLLSPKTQGVIASKNWMYPASRAVSVPDPYASLSIPDQILNISATDIFKKRESWIQEWQKIMAKN